MDLGTTAERADIQKAVHEFAAREFDQDVALQLEQSNQFPFALWRKACDLGLKGIDFPQEYGGQGYGFIEKLIVLHELSRVDSSLGTAIGLADIGSRIILKLGNEEQRRLFLSAVTRGEAIFCLIADGPVGNAPPPLQVRRVGSSFLVRGKKENVVNGAIASHILLVIGADPAAAHDGYVFCFKRDREHLHRQEYRKGLGLKASSPGMLVFDDVRLEESDLLSCRGSSDGLVLESLNERKIETALQTLGVAENAFRRALEHAKQREQFQRKIIHFQAVQLIIAGMATTLEAAKAFSWRILGLMDNEGLELQTGAALVTMLKNFCADASPDVVLDAIRVLGGYGLVTDYHLERMFRDVVALRDLEGDPIEQKGSVAMDLANVTTAL